MGKNVNLAMSDTNCILYCRDSVEPVWGVYKAQISSRGGEISFESVAELEEEAGNASMAVISKCIKNVE